MKRTSDYLDELRDALGCTSDAQLMKATGWSPTIVLRYRKNRGAFSDETALQVAALLRIDPAQVLADMAAARAKRPEVRVVWEGIARKVASGAGMLILGEFLLTGGIGAPIRAATPACESVIHYTKRMRRWLAGRRFSRIPRPTVTPA